MNKERFIEIYNEKVRYEINSLFIWDNDSVYEYDKKYQNYANMNVIFRKIKKNGDFEYVYLCEENCHLYDVDFKGPHKAASLILKDKLEYYGDKIDDITNKISKLESKYKDLQSNIERLEKNNVFKTTKPIKQTKKRAMQ